MKLGLSLSPSPSRLESVHVRLSVWQQPSTKQGASQRAPEPSSTAYTAALEVKTKAPVPSQRASAALISPR